MMNFSIDTFIQAIKSLSIHVATPSFFVSRARRVTLYFALSADVR